MKKNNSHTTTPFSIERKLVADANRIGKKIPLMHGFGEIDVTEIRNKIRAIRRKNKSQLSLTTYLLYVFVRTIDENKHMHACKSWNNKLYTFDDIDVFFPVELKDNIVNPKIIRSSNRKSILELEHEILSAKGQEKIHFDFLKKLFIRYPRFVRDFIYSIIINRPLLRKDTFGTAFFSSVNSATNIKGYAIPITFHSISMYLGMTERRTIIVNDSFEIREFLSITISADHDVVDGAMFARFILKIKANIDSLIDTL